MALERRCNPTSAAMAVEMSAAIAAVMMMGVSPTIITMGVPVLPPVWGLAKNTCQSDASGGLSASRNWAIRAIAPPAAMARTVTAREDRRASSEVMAIRASIESKGKAMTRAHDPQKTASGWRSLASSSNPEGMAASVENMNQRNCGSELP